MSDVQPRQFGSVVQWNFPSDTYPESCGNQLQSAGDPLRAVTEERRKWANQQRHPSHETSEGINDQQAVTDTVEYTFPWNVNSGVLLHSPYGANNGISSFDGPEEDTSGITSGSFLHLPSTLATTHDADNYIPQHLFGHNPEGSYTIPDSLLSAGAETLITPSVSWQVPFTSGDIGHLPSIHDGPSGLSAGPAMWPTDGNAQDIGRFLPWSGGADPYAPLGLMGYNPGSIIPFTLHDEYGPDPSQALVPPALQQGSGAGHTGDGVMPAWMPASVSTSTEVRHDSNTHKTTNAEEITLSPTPSDAPTLQPAHGGHSQSSFEARWVDPDEVLPIIHRQSKETASLPCGFCVKKFSDLNSRNKHEKLHSRTRGNQPSCPACKKKFARLDAVVRHISRLYEKDRTNDCVVVALRRGWRYRARGRGKYLLPGQGREE